VKDLFKKLGIHSTHFTHASRAAAAGHLEGSGVQQDQIRRAGRWSHDKMNDCYLTGLPMESLRAFAGFSVSKGSYFIRRNTVEPSLELQKMIFPMADIWLDRLQRLDGCQEDLAGMGFLKLLIYARLVILQDSVLMQPKFPNLDIWKLPVFQTTEYYAFAEELRNSMSAVADPLDIRLQACVPIINEKLTLLQSTVTAHQQSSNAYMSTMLASVKSMLVASQAEITSTIKQQRLHITYNGDTLQLPSPASSIQHHTTLPMPSQNNAAIGRDSNETSTSNTLAAIGLTATPSTLVSDPVHDLPAVSTTTNSPLSTYRMSRILTTVQELWTEYEYGLDSHMSIKQMDSELQNKWRQNDKDRMHYNRRKLIWSKVQDMINQHGLSESGAVERLEAYRKSKKLSLEKLNSIIKALPQSYAFIE